jgi:hypothetical protein
MKIINILSALLFTAAIAAPIQSTAATTEVPLVQLAQNRTPSASCDRNRKACYAGSAHTGSFGSRYVPPEAVRMCEEAYRACIGRR